MRRGKLVKIRLIKKEDILNYENDLQELFENLRLLNIEDLKSNLIEFISKEMCVCIGAFKENELIGILWAYKREFAGAKRYHINYFSIKNKQQNYGIGSRLIEKLKEIVKKENIKIIDLNVDMENKIARNFYRKNNFKEEKILLYLDIGE